MRIKQCHKILTEIITNFILIAILFSFIYSTKNTNSYYYATQIQNSFIDGFITQNSLTGTTFIISPDNYNSAPFYNLNDYVSLTPVGYTGQSLNFGDEYYFYGSFETDIMATIYEMKYKINLSSSEFQVSTNPSWTPGTKSYVTEIALLDDNKDILVMSKLATFVVIYISIREQARFLEDSL